MKATIVECVMGVLGFDEENRLVDYTLFPKDPKEIAERLSKMETGRIVEELIDLVERLKTKDYTFFVFENNEIARNAHERLKIAVEVTHPSSAGELLRTDLERFALQTGFVREAEELREWTHKVSMELSRLRVRKAVERRDLVVAQAIQTVDDLDKTVNLFMGRIREWYGLHFPELDRLVEKHETYARLVSRLGTRENFVVENLEKEGLPKARAEQVGEAAQRSMGADLPQEDLSQIQALCNNTLLLYDERQKMEGYMDSAMESVAPNIQALIGSLLGARLIALAGGLGNLARMPASTIQVLGAEKALFRSLKSGTRPPKHGIIFQHTLIHEAKRWQRGKIARALAGKLAIAARTDAFSGKYLGDSLKADLEKRMREIEEKYAEPPPTPPKVFPERPRQRRPPRRSRRGHRG